MMLSAAIKEFSQLSVIVGREAAAHLIAESTVGLKFNLKAETIAAKW